MDLGSYFQVLGLSERLISEPIESKPSLLPDAPLIHVTVRNAQERLALDQQACVLFNKRDKFLRMIHFMQKMALSGKLWSSKSEEVELIRLGSTLAQIDAQLTETLSKIAKLTGKVEVMLSWEGGSAVQDFSPRSKNKKISRGVQEEIPEEPTEGDHKMEITGYKVFLNGKQYGLTVNSDVKNMVLRVSVINDYRKFRRQKLRRRKYNGQKFQLLITFPS